MYYVADTHSFLWYLADSLSLSNKARMLFDLAENRVIKKIYPKTIW